MSFSNAGTAHASSRSRRSCSSPASARAARPGSCVAVKTRHRASWGDLLVRSSRTVCRFPFRLVVSTRWAGGSDLRSSSTTRATCGERSWNPSGNSSRLAPAEVFPPCMSSANLPAAPGSNGSRTTVVAQPSSSSSTGSAARSASASSGRAIRSTGASNPSPRRSSTPGTERICSRAHSRSNPNAPELLKNWGASVTTRTDLTPTPKRPIWPPLLRDILIRRMVSAPSAVTGEPSLAQ